MSNKTNKTAGFTLIEIMIVVGIVLILAVIAIPAMMRSKMVGNEASAITALKTLATACNFYAMKNYDFPPAGAAGLQALYSGNPPYINYDFSSSKDGYDFTYVFTAGDTDFSIIAQPVKYNISGTRSFYTDSTAIVRYCQIKDCTPNGLSATIE